MDVFLNNDTNEVTFTADFMPVDEAELDPVVNKKFKVLRGELIHEGKYFPGNLEGKNIWVGYDVLEANANSFNMTYSTLNHDKGIMDRNGFLDNVHPVSDKRALVGDLLIPRIDKNKDFIDMVNTVYKGKSMIDAVSVTFEWDELNSELAEKMGVDYYPTKIKGTGVGYVYDGADSGARITEILNHKDNERKSKMDEKDIAKIQELSADKAKAATELEKKDDVLHQREEEIVGLRERLEVFEKEKADRDAKELEGLREEVIGKAPDISKEKVNSMSREALEALLEFIGDEEKPAEKTEKEPVKETTPAKPDDAAAGYKPERELTFERTKNGKLAFYAERPGYIPDSVPGGEMLKKLTGGS